MKSIFTIFLDIEKLIYKVLMWVILVPKTIVHIVFNPAWAPIYVKDELEKDETPFDEYISPIILLLIVALIPALAFNLLPSFGASLSSPAQVNTTTDRYISFDVVTDFRSSSAEMEYFHVWSVSRIGEQAPPVVQADGSVTLVSGGVFAFAPEVHYPGNPANRIATVDENTVTDNFLFTFPEPGEYIVSVTAGKYYPERFDPASGAGIPTETYSKSLRVIVPSRTDLKIVFPEDPSAAAAETAKSTGFENFTAQVQKENTIFLALALMLPPLLFALATKFLTTSIGEDTLKENFYTQCYYFSPLSLAIWASYYARYFYTSDAYFFANNDLAIQIIWLPPLLAALWFVRAEVKTIEDARGTSGPRAIIITLACIAILLAAAFIIFRFAVLQDDARLAAIRIFPLLSAVLIGGFGIAWYRRRKARKENMYSSHFLWIGVNAVVLVALLNFVSARFGVQSQPQVVSRTSIAEVSPTAESIPATEPPTSIELSPTPTAEIISSLDTPLPEITSTPFIEASPTPNPYYAEEFNAVPPTWFEFMTSGDTSLVEKSFDRGALAIQLLKRDELTPRFYYINDAFSYSDVKVGAVVTNQGNNANGVGLVCRYSDLGWYEAQVSNSERFSIYVVDNVGIFSQGYNEVLTGDSKAIRSGLSTNIYTLYCQGNVIRLFVNDELLGEYIDTNFGFTDGKIGLSVWSPQSLPVNVDFETLTVSAP